MLAGSKRPRKEVKKSGFFRFLWLLIVLLLLVLLFSLRALKPKTSSSEGNEMYEEVRLRTHEFIQGYKAQLEADFGFLDTPQKETKENTQPTSVANRDEKITTDPNEVVHRDAGPPHKSSFTKFSDVMPKDVSTSSSSSPNLIIGMAKDTDAKNLVTFCGSLRRHSDANVVLFMNTPISDRSKEIANKYNVQVIPFASSDFDPMYQQYHPSTLRWILMDNFFKDERNKDKYKYVWMIDVRDSMFQADPFEMIAHETSAFYAFKGVEDKTISQCGWNGGWVKDCFGNAKLNEIGHNNIICSGVSVGTIDVVLLYLSSMRSIVEGKSNDHFPSCERNGVDQGVHNVLVHTNQIPHLKIFNQASSPVLNLQARIADVNEAKGLVRNKAGETAAVVHQYDRFPALQNTLFKQYAYWIDFSDPMFEWNADKECQRFEYKKDVDLFKGICDYKIKGGMTGPNSCCSVCTSLPDCSSFTFYQGQCFLKKGCRAGSRRNSGRLPGAVSAYLTQ